MVCSVSDIKVVFKVACANISLHRSLSLVVHFVSSLQNKFLLVYKHVKQVQVLDSIKKAARANTGTLYSTLKC